MAIEHQNKNHSIRSEEAVIGACFLDNSAWDVISNILQADDLYFLQTRILFKTIKKLAEQSIPFDIISVSDLLQKDSSMEKVGGLAYIAGIAGNTPSAANAKAYADIVKNFSVLRKIDETGFSIQQLANNNPHYSACEVLTRAESLVLAIGEDSFKASGNELSPIQSIMKNTLLKIKEASNSNGLLGLSTGILELDNLICGFQKKDLIYLAGRPGMGKTSLAMNIGLRQAIAGNNVSVFSLEMASEQLGIRMMSSLSGIDSNLIKTGKFDTEQAKIISNAVTKISESNMAIDDKSSCSVDYMRSKLRKRVRDKGPIKLIVVDYIQQISCANNLSDNKNDILTKISSGLKGIAKEFDVPVLALSALNRSLESRINKRPMLSDLRDSGSLEQDADLVIFVYRHEIYDPSPESQGKAEIILAKHRNGPIGTVHVGFDKKTTTFHDKSSLTSQRIR